MKLYFQVEGSGEPVVLVHGLFGSSTNLRGMARKLAERFRVINVDLQNHGRSPHTSSMTYHDMSEALYDLKEQIAAPRLNWIGHSMGGKAVMNLALTHSDCVNRLIVLDIAPVNYRHGHAELIDAMFNIDLKGIANRTDADRALSEVVADSATRMFLLQNLKLDAGQYTWRINLPVLRQFYDDIMTFPDLTGSTFYGPTLVLSGADSSYVSSGHHTIILRYFPNAAFSVVDGAGHWMHVDQPQSVHEVITKFLSKGRVYDKNYE